MQQHSESNNKLTRINCKIPAEPAGAQTVLVSLFPLSIFFVHQHPEVKPSAWIRTRNGQQLGLL